MDDDASRKIDDTHLLQPASTPDPVRHGGVDQQNPDHDEPQIGCKLHATCEGAGDERRRDDDKHHLVQEEDEEGDRRRICGAGCYAHATKPEEFQPADDTTDIMSKRQGKPTKKPDEAHEAHGDEALQHKRQHILAPRETAIEKGKPRGHDKDEGLSLIHISEPTRLGMISYAVFCLKKKKK